MVLLERGKEEAIVLTVLVGGGQAWNDLRGLTIANEKKWISAGMMFVTGGAGWGPRKLEGKVLGDRRTTNPRVKRGGLMLKSKLVGFGRSHELIGRNMSGALVFKGKTERMGTLESEIRPATEENPFAH